VEERTDALTSAERQFVWGLRYIDDLIIRDRSTANNGSINERRYGMQDGNWNMIAICDITGFVGERYAYSAYGTPVFMTGAGTVQSTSPIGFETLYAGYRWDGNSPQMYYVRNRFLLPMIGTWCQRDPLDYESDSMNLLGYLLTAPVNFIDPMGLQARMPQMHRSTWMPRASRTSTMPRTLRPTIRPPRRFPIRGPRTPQDPVEINPPWGATSVAPTIGAPRVSISASPASEPSISSGDPAPSTCTQEVLAWPQQSIQTLPNPSGSRDCKTAFGFQQCPPSDSSVFGALSAWVQQLLRAIGAPRLHVEFGDCHIATQFTATERTLTHSPHCTLGSPALNVHCRILIYNTLHLLPVIIPVRDVWASTTCCLCCNDKELAVNCAAPHQGTTDKRPILEGLKEAVESAT